MKTASFILFLLFSLSALTCKKEPPVVPPSPPPSGPDTTSHNFTFTQYTFGGTGGSSYFKDVAIVSDTDIWAVGAIYTTADTMYNVARWDGKKWELKKIPFVGSCSAVMYPPLQGIWAFGTNNILFTNGGSIVRFDGTSAEMDCGMNSLLTGAINRIFAINPENIYVVGNAGTIVHYDGTTWTKQSSGTTIDLRDVWGTADGSVVWACGYSNDNSQSVLLKYDGTSWQTVWSSRPSAPPYGGLIISLWGGQHLYLAGTDGIFQQDVAGKDSVEHLFSLTNFPYRIKGSSESNVAFVGDDAMIYHYNGSTWKLLNLSTQGHPLYSVAVSTNMIVAVGSDYSVFPNQAMISVGRRE